MGVDHDHDHAGCSYSHNHNGTNKLEAVNDDEVIITQVRTTRNRKRKKSENYDEDEEEEAIPTKKKKNPKKEDGEKRAKRFRAKQPVAYEELLNRATTQRMFVLDRKDTGTDEAPEQTIDLAGSTGNVYRVVIGKVPSCNCPFAIKHRSECKHIVYVLHRTLKAPANLAYQLAFLKSELQQIFAHAPPIPTGEAEDNHGNRKPIADDCPICCDEFDAAHEEIVYCKAACGNNIHKACFEKWAAQKSGAGATITCPFCRQPWQGDAIDMKKIANMGTDLNHEGYVNVGGQLGLSSQRDYSTYHSFWVNRQLRAGLL